ncbi:MAG: peptide chain release factor N(5)-glutamine methyltransferase [Planctomycetota bacterium]
MSDAPWTILRLLEWTTQFFKDRGSPSPRLDAEVLLAHARQCERIDLYAAFAEVPDDEVRVGFREMVRRRGAGMPVAYIVGHKEFYSLKFRVDESTLIPRPETEHLVIESLDRLKAMRETAPEDRPLRILDLGTGSGAIAISIAKHAADVEITAVDISEPALEIAKWNAAKIGVQDRIEFLRGDLFEPLATGRRFDLIVSNPPYVSTTEYEALDAEVKDHEPKTALVADGEGTALIGKILKACDQLLEPGGSVLIELSPMIADRCLEMARAAGLSEVVLMKDLAGHQRVLGAVLGG